MTKKTELLKSANISSPENNHHDHQQQYFFCACWYTHTHGSLYQSLNSTTRKYVLNPGRHPRKNCQSYEKQIIVTYTKCRSRRRHHHHHAKPSNIKERKKQKMQNLREKITNTNYLEQNGNQRVKKHCLLYNTHLNHVPLCVFFQMLLLFFSCLLFVFGFR